MLEAGVAVVLSAFLVVAATSCSLKQDRQAVSAAIAPVEKAPAPPAKKDNVAPATTFVANPFCKACHADFDDEALAVRHKTAGIGCERCHGESLRHRSDEANVTPPDLMYPKERINPTCMMCHPRQTIQQVHSHKVVLETNLSALEATPAGHGAKYCTDCHAREHHMKVRAIQWDKCTGKVLP